LWFSRYSVDISRYFKSLADVSRYFRSVVDVNRYFILVEFSEILGLVKSGRFFRFLFRVRIVGYKAFLFAAKGGK